MISSERKSPIAFVAAETFGAAFEDWLGLVGLSHAGAQVLPAARYYVVLK